MAGSNGEERRVDDKPSARARLAAEHEAASVIALGASAGGLAAVTALLEAMPSDSGAAIVVIQHLDPTRNSQLVELLRRATAMEVLPITNGARVAPNCVYVIQPNTTAVMDGDRFSVCEPAEPRGLRRPIDHFFSSLAQHWGARAIGVVLSGTGSDGTRGLLAIKQAGGLSLVQKPDTAGHPGMPRNAAASGAADYVVQIPGMPAAIARYMQHPYAGGEPVDGVAVATDQLTPILDIVRGVTGHDLHGYRPNTLRRRVHRRMGMHGIRDAAAYAELLRAEPDEVHRLFGDLLIGVTAFFREPEVFEVLANDVLPAILDRKSDGEPIRAWVPGCATGEEAYSIAILLIEHVAASGKSCPIQVFATDVDEAALDTARAGMYAAERLTDLSEARTQRFFQKDRGVYRASKDLRDVVVFAPQNLLTDPPFSQMDLVSCRNLLIYLKPDIQRRVIALFHFALGTGGFLVLGSAETLGSRHPLFTPVSEAHRIYRRNDTAVRGALEIPLGPRRRVRSLHGEQHFGPFMHTGLRELTERALLADFAPAAALIDRDGDIQFLSGDTDAYLAVQSGEPSKNILELARRGLRGPLRKALVHVCRDGADDSEAIAQVKVGNRYRDVMVRLKPIRNADAGPLYLFTFERVPETTTTPATPVTDDSIVQQLEAELQATRDDLQSTIEELGASNEELRASNEEVLSMNEELQSTNEELETSKEELQSLNEELSTVNAQLQDKLAELARANNDIENLLASADLATLFLDRELRIKRFTDATRKLFNLITTDIGRAITDITARYEDQDLAARAAEVLSTLVPHETEVRDHDGNWYSRRILPYRTADDHIEGVVVTFANISVQKRAEEMVSHARDELETRVAARTAELAEAVAKLEAEVREHAAAQQELLAERDRIDSILTTAVDGIIVLDDTGAIETCNRAAEGMFGYAEGELIGQSVSVLMAEPERSQHQDYIDRYLRTGHAAVIGSSREVMGRRKDGTSLTIDLTVGETHVGKHHCFTGFLRDVSERKRLEQQIRQTQKMEAIGRLASGIAHDFNNLLMGISGCANIAVRQLDDRSPVLPYLKEIREAAVSGASITRHLLTFARKREEVRVPLELNTAVSRAQALLERLLGEDVELDVNLPAQRLWVHWDAGQFEQVLINLAVNARDAMPSGGRLSIRVTERLLGDDDVRAHSGLGTGPHALVSVSDSGTGIAEEIRAHIFEPFFTTKEPGAGTGLGLSTVYALIKAVGGDIRIHSKIGVGTTFELLLPLVDAPQRDAGDVAEAAGGHETILVIEDEPLVRMTLRHYLEAKGYNVLDANDSSEAMAICRGRREPVALLVTDVVLPGTSGPETAQQISKQFPGMQTLFVSAHAREQLGGRLPAHAQLLHKPFTSEALTTRVRNMLDQTDGPVAAPRPLPSVLVVEDNMSALEASCELIGDMGYQVLGASCAAEACNLARQREAAFDIVITDVGLPDMSGGELVERLSELAPPQCVVYISGRTADDPLVSPLLEPPNTYFLEKPWNPGELEQLLEDALRA